MRKKSKGDIETKELPRQVSRAASIRTNLVKDDDCVGVELKGVRRLPQPLQARVRDGKARHCQAELEGMLGAPVFLDSDDLSDLTKLLDQVEESDILLLFQSRNVLCRPYCLLELYTAVEKGIPIVAMRVRGANEYQFDEATAFLKHLDTELDRANPGASKLLQKHGVDLDAAFKLSMAVPNLISIDFNPSGSRNNLKASLFDVAQTMRIATPSIVDDEEKSEWLRSRGDPPSAPGKRASLGGSPAGRRASVGSGAKKATLALVPFDVPDLPECFEPRDAVVRRLHAAVGVAEPPPPPAAVAAHDDDEAKAAKEEHKAVQTFGDLAAQKRAGDRHRDGRFREDDARGGARARRGGARRLRQGPVGDARADAQRGGAAGFLYKQLTDATLPAGVSPEAARAELSKASREIKMLLLLDDVWDAKDERPLAFLDLGPASRSRCIVTTRIRGRFKGAELDLASLSAEEGVHMLLASAAVDQADLAGAGGGGAQDRAHVRRTAAHARGRRLDDRCTHRTGRRKCRRC